MHFTRLRLNGFKSFTDPTDLVIHPGLTGVVGPNGCGKSNLLEALRWIMGENRPTAMRGAGMEDVIFAGTDTRNARHFAEVSLQIDNHARLAPAAFNDADHLDITRRITRDAGSAYKINGREVRARDVQMLFADASTGAHSPALVRQGQISELINARPKARRRILEEAAGISGLYQRRHEAELRLRATETNLERVGDLIEQLAAQLAQLGRQARQAARYREIGERLRATEGRVLFRRWQEADAARIEGEARFQQAVRDAALAERAVLDALRLREGCEAGLPALMEETTIAAAVVQRLDVQRQTLAGDEARAREAVSRLTGRLAQLASDIAREAGLNRDAAEMIAQLTREAEQIAGASLGQDDRLAEAMALTEAAGTALAGAEAAQEAAAAELAALSARHQTLSAQIADLERAQTRSRAARDGALDEQRSLTGARDAAELALARASAERAATDAQVSAAEQALGDLDAALAEARAQDSAARATLAEAEGHAASLRAEERGLAQIVAKARGAGQAVLDQLRVAPGHEQALGAALADDLRAPLAEGGSGWHQLAPYPDAQPLPEGAAPLVAQVQAPEALARRLAQIGVVSPDQGRALHAALRPGQRLVSLAGDLWRWDGLHHAAGEAPTAAALQLQQVNRLAEVQAALAVAEQALAVERAAQASHKAQLDAVAQAERQAREGRRAAEQQLSAASRAVSQAETALASAVTRLETAGARLARASQDLEAQEVALSAARAAFAALPDLAAQRSALDAVKREVGAARDAMLARREAAERLRRAAHGRKMRAAEIAKQHDSWQARQGSADTRIHDLEARKSEAESDLKAATGAPEQIAAQRSQLDADFARAQARLTAAQDAQSAADGALRSARDAERSAERSASQAREQRAALDARRDAAQEAVTQAAARILEEMECTPEALAQQLGTGLDALGDLRALEDEAARLRRARDALGAVNLRAEEDAREVQTEHDALVREKADLEAAVAKLRAGIHALNREGRERLLIAFDKVNASFGTLFAHLFNGGEARLVLVESDDPLDAGLEILCQPPGKKLSTLSLLSGGEQTLTALALIFAVFLANPAPICVLDEVDAPLDDANVARFCDLLDEMTRRADTRYLIITHNALSMARMDRLFGVTMAERGVSQLVSVDLKAAETLVA
ncbi:MAG: chromosome segregation protein SMC [Roseinatronobacter sp.]